MKYNNKKTTVEGIIFDSKKEANRYLELKLLEKAGQIKDLELQPKFELLPTVRRNGKTYRKCTYIADFKYFDIKESKYIVEDVKGFKTKEFRLKEKMFVAKYDYELKLT
jgi:hypothetical protein